MGLQCDRENVKRDWQEDVMRSQGQRRSETIRKMKTEAQNQRREGNDVTNSLQIVMRSRGPARNLISRVLIEKQSPDTQKLTLLSSGNKCLPGPTVPSGSGAEQRGFVLYLYYLLFKNENLLFIILSTITTEH